MPIRQPDKTRDDLLPEERALSRRYREASRETSPAALDQAILAKARAALDTPRGGVSVAKRWAVPLSIAAVMVLSVGVVLRLLEPGAIEPSASSPTIVPTPPAVADRVAGERARKLAKTEGRAKMPATPPAVPEAAPAAQWAPARSETSANVTSEVERHSDGASLPATRTGSTPIGAAQRPSTSVVAADSQARAKADGVSARLLADVPAANPEKKRVVGDRAEVISVRTNGSPGAYEFVVGVRSPDTGCANYADWWEVVGVDGRLWHRQVLAHSHVGEQPFVRASGPVPLSPATVVWVRAHMSTTGYGGGAFKGSVETGFAPVDLPADFAAALVTQPPLPQRCDF